MINEFGKIGITFVGPLDDNIDPTILKNQTDKLGTKAESSGKNITCGTKLLPVEVKKLLFPFPMKYQIRSVFKLLFPGLNQEVQIRNK
jgi:hypothetical protein